MIFCLILNPLNKRSFFFRIYQKKVWDFIQKVKETMHSSSVSSSSGSKHSSNMQQISDIFSQTESISQYIKSHLKDKANDETFILLQEFFGVFHDQMRINFDLRNQLTIFKKKQKKYNISDLQTTKANVETFMQYFNKTRQIDHQNLHDIALTLQDDIKLLKELRIFTNNRMKIKQSTREYEAKIEKMEQKINQITETKGKISNDLKQIIDSSNNNIIRLQNEIDEIRPAVEALRQRVQEKEENKKHLIEVLHERNQMIEEARKIHAESHERRHNTKEELRTLHGQLLAEYHNLQYQEKPLADALEEAEQKLKDIKNQNAQEIEQIKQQSEIAEHKIKTIDSKLEDLRSVRQKNQTEIAEAKRTIELQRCQHENSLSEMKVLKQEIEKIDSKLIRMSRDSETPNNQLSYISSKREETSEKIREKTIKIEDLRKQNQKISSMVRVTNESSDSLEKENSEMRVTVSETEVKVKKERETYQSEIERRRLARQTIKAFEKMRDSLRLSNMSDSFVIAQKAVEFARSTNERPKHCRICSDSDSDDDIPMRVTNQSVEDEIRKVAVRISKLNQQLQ